MDQATNDRILAGMKYENDRDAPPPGFPRLPRIPAGRYLDPEFLRLERDAMWRSSWLYALHIDELPDKGSYRLWERTGSPILIVNAGDGEYRAFYNTCAHRGAPLVQNASGCKKLLVCPYHAWSYDLEGRLKAVRDPRDFPDFDMSRYGLTRVRCERFGPWIFINEDPQAGPLAKAVAPFADHWSSLDPDNMAHIHTSSHEVPCNVKVLLDAFMESYHIASIHKQTVNRFLNHLGTYIELYDGGNMLMVTPQKREDWEDPGAKGMARIPTATMVQRVHNPSCHFFPNLVAPVSDSGVPFLTFWPKDDNTMVIDSHWFGPRASQDHPNWKIRVDNWERILDEDLQFAGDIQKSMESGGFKGLALSYQERRIYFWHEEVDRRIGPDRVPQTLRIKPLLDDYVR
jgi:phenylpropionate dioxygenase-like ring-hydroxylating dioxygenase large terminal subunit